MAKSEIEARSSGGASGRWFLPAGARDLSLGSGVFADEINEPTDLPLNTDKKYLENSPPSHRGDIEVRVARSVEELYLATHVDNQLSVHSAGDVYSGYLNVAYDQQEWQRTNTLGVVICIYLPDKVERFNSYELKADAQKLRDHDPAAFVAKYGTHFVSRVFHARAAHVELRLTDLDAITYQKLTLNAGAKGTYYAVMGKDDLAVRQETLRAASEYRMSLHLSFLGMPNAEKLTTALKQALSLPDSAPLPLSGVDQQLRGRLLIDKSTSILNAAVDLTFAAIETPAVEGYELTSMNKLGLPNAFLGEWSFSKQERYRALLAEIAKAEDKYAAIDDVVSGADPRYRLLSPAQRNELAQPEVKEKYQRYIDELRDRRATCFKSTQNIDRACGFTDLRKPPYELIKDNSIRPVLDYVIESEGGRTSIDGFESTRLLALGNYNFDPYLTARSVAGGISAVAERLASDSFTIFARVRGRYLDRCGMKIVGTGAGLWQGDSNLGRPPNFSIDSPEPVIYSQLNDEKEARVPLVLVKKGSISVADSPFIRFVQEQRHLWGSFNQNYFFYAFLDGDVRLLVLDKISPQPWIIRISFPTWYVHGFNGTNFNGMQGIVPLSAPAPLYSNVGRLKLARLKLRGDECSARVTVRDLRQEGTHVYVAFQVDVDREASAGSFFYEVYWNNTRTGDNLVQRHGRIGWHGGDGSDPKVYDEFDVGQDEVVREIKVDIETIICVSQ